MVFALLFLALPFFIFAITLSKGKGASLLSGYNALSDEEKAQYDEVALCRFMGKIMYIVTACLILSAISEFLHSVPLFLISLFLLLASIAFSMIYSNTKNRFKKV